MMQEASMVNAMIWHFTDGPFQQARDASMRAEMVGRNTQGCANQWSDPVTHSWVYGCDAERIMEMRWADALEKLIVGSR